MISKKPAIEDKDDDFVDFAGIRNDISFVLRSPKRHPKLAAGCVLFVLIAAAASSLVIKDIYQVQASLLAQRNPVMLTLSNPGLARGADWEAPTRAARETIIRRGNLTALCEQTGLVDRHLAGRSMLGRLRAWFYQKMSGRTESRSELLDSLVDTVEKRLWVSIGAEGTVTIGFEWPDEQIAFLIVEAAVQNFLEERHASEVAVLGETITLLEGSASRLQQEVSASLNELERKERARPPSSHRLGITRPAPVRRDDDTGRVESTLSARRRALADLEEFRQRRLAELNTQLAQKQSTYAEQHPEILNTKQSIAILTQPSPQAEFLRAEIKELEKELTRRGSPVGSDGGAAFATEFIEPRMGAEPEDVRIEYDRSHLRFIRDQYASALQRLSSARAELETAQAAFKYRYSVISPPQHPKGPKRPYTLLRILGGIVGGVGLALFVCTAIDVRSGRILEEWQIPEQLGLTVLAQLPPRPPHS
jgi:uncharacterized protein involved in exopolysaccharide biosynthesis